MNSYWKRGIGLDILIQDEDTTIYFEFISISISNYYFQILIVYDPTMIFDSGQQQIKKSYFYLPIIDRVSNNNTIIGIFCLVYSNLLLAEIYTTAHS